MPPSEHRLPWPILRSYNFTLNKTPLFALEDADVACAAARRGLPVSSSCFTPWQSRTVAVSAADLAPASLSLLQKRKYPYY